MSTVKATGSIEFGGRIREARKELGMSQNKLARALEVSDRAVQNWEQGRRSPRTYLLKRLSEVTGKPIAWFFEEAA